MLKMTKYRKEIMDVLTNCPRALSANEIHKKLPHINLVTIYRNLDAFSEGGTIKKLYLDSNEALYEFQKHPHHHAICTDCDNVTHFAIDENKLMKVFSLSNFDIRDIEVVVRGKCVHKHAK